MGAVPSKENYPAISLMLAHAAAFARAQKAGASTTAKNTFPLRTETAKPAGRVRSVKLSGSGS